MALPAARTPGSQTASKIQRDGRLSVIRHRFIAWGLLPLTGCADWEKKSDTRAETRKHEKARAGLGIPTS